MRLRVELVGVFRGEEEMKSAEDGSRRRMPRRRSVRGMVGEGVLGSIVSDRLPA